MKNEINKNEVVNSSISQDNIINTSYAKKERIKKLMSGDYYIAFNKTQDIPIWNYLISEDKIRIFIYDENDNTIYDSFITDAPDSLFNYGECFQKVSFIGLNLDENIVSRKNFYLFENQICNN